MPKFNVEVSFDLTSELEIEIDRHQFLDPSGVDEYEDDSYFQSVPLTSSGGNLKFQIEAEDEEDAEHQVEERIHDGQEVEDRNGLTWLVDNVGVNLDEVEVEMTKEYAAELVRQLIDTSYPEGDIRKALHFVLGILLTTPFDS